MSASDTMQNVINLLSALGILGPIQAAVIVAVTIASIRWFLDR